MNRLSLAAAALAMLCIAAESNPPPPEIKVETVTLDNGLTILLNQDKRLPVVAIEMRYLVGSAHEEKGRSGFAHLFEHLMFQGSQNFDGEYFKPFAAIGADINGTTNADRTNYYERVPSNYLELAMWMESDRMANLLPALTQAKLDNQRDVVKNERRQRYENTPYGLVWKYFHNTLFPVGHPYQHTTIGSHKDLTAASLDDVKAFFAKYYVAKNAVLTIVGDFERDEALALAERYFGSIKSGERAAMPTAEMPALKAIKTVAETDDVKLPRVYMAWHTPAFLKPGDAEFDILASILADGKTSRLYQPLVYTQRVAKDVSAFQVSMALGSFFVVQATAAPGKTLKELQAALKKTLKTALATPATDDEMARAVNGWRKSFYGRVESVISRATMLSTYYHLVGKADFLAEDLARYVDLTPKKIHDANTKWLGTDNFVKVTIVPGEQPKEVK